jgi:hypothetical protein
MTPHHRRQLDRIASDLRSMPPVCPGCAHRRGKAVLVRDDLPPVCTRCNGIPERMLFVYDFYEWDRKRVLTVDGAWGESDLRWAGMMLAMGQRLREKGDAHRAKLKQNGETK